MRKCVNCGKVSESYNDIKCAYCGGALAEVNMVSCRNCGAPVSADAGFCRNCGASVNYVPETPPVMPGTGVYLRESVDTEDKEKNKTLIIAIAIVASVCILAIAIVLAASLLKEDEGYVSEKEEVSDKEDKDESKETENKNDDKSDSDEKEIEEEEEKPDEEPSEPEKQEPEEEKPVENITPKEPSVPAEPQKNTEVIDNTRRQEDFVKLENAVDNYVYSFVSALNNRDSSYMLPYTMSGSSSSNVYNTQTKFIHSGKYEYEEYIDSYIIGEASYENANTCVISVYEIYNVMEPGKDWRRQEQTARYRMKRDSYGDWKVYEFVGSVKTH